MTVAEALREAASRLQAVSDTARLDAELLMAHALGVSRSDLLLTRLDQYAVAEFDYLVARRERHEPIAYILGTQDFMGRDFVVSPAVLIPRSDSEATINAALEASPEFPSVLDLGTGSGALLITFLAEQPEASGIGIDRAQDALRIAHENAQRLYVAPACRFLLRDWREPDWSSDLGQFDVIIANPPYVENDADLDPDVRDWEPAGALFAGPDGLDDYRILIPQLPALLTPGGVAVLEIGATQADAVATIAAAAGFRSELRRDLGRRPRALVLRLGVV
jgi:release factor glutamine methyltransferase